MVRELWLSAFVFCFGVPLVFVVDSRLIRRFLFGWACESGAGGAGSSACFRFCCYVHEVSWFAGHGLGRGEGTDVFGVFCRMVTSSVVASSSSSHSSQVTGNTRCFCVFGGVEARWE